MEEEVVHQIRSDQDITVTVTVTVTVTYTKE